MMKHYLFSVIVLLCGFTDLSAQYVYTIKADSVKITNCDSAELILENHTQNVPGFLFNTGNGRTIFKRGAQKLNDSTYLIGADTLKLKTNSWMQGGNAFGATGVLGTTDSNNLDFYTNNTQQVRLTSGGDLLVGTANDSGYKFQVDGQINLNNCTGTSIVTSPNHLAIKSGVVDVNTSLTRFYNGSDPSSTFFGASPTGADFGNPSGSYLMDITAGSSFLRIQGYGDGSGITQITNYGSGYYPLFQIVSPIKFVSATPILGYNYLFTAQGGSGQAFAIQDSSLRSKFSVNGPTGNVLINIDPLYGGVDDGNTLQVHGASTFSDSMILKVVPVGTSSDSVLVWNAMTHAIHKVPQSSIGGTAMNGTIDSSLAVNGMLTAKRLKLSQTGWPDYVFDSSYRLLPISGLERYIKDNNHLPGISSAAEVEKKGLDVGDNQAALLKKVEELTLYIIEQNKEINSLKEEVEDLKKQMLRKSN
jgi:hypothetical protein